MSKPVAWINLEAWESGKYPPDDCFSDEEFTGSIPLYTHPVKELMDEEIIDLINRHIDYVPDEDNGMKLVGVMDFAKAILRKAQEK